MEYAHLWKLKNTRRPIYIGFSINGVGSRTKVKIPRNGGDDVDDVIMNYFVGAGYKMAYKTNKRFIWNLLLSLGYACTDEDFNTADGFGVYAEMGCEYMLSKHWSAGVTLGGMSSTYKQPAGWTAANINTESITMACTQSLPTTSNYGTRHIDFKSSEAILFSYRKNIASLPSLKRRSRMLILG